jgi:hypothetical protein
MPSPREMTDHCRSAPVIRLMRGVALIVALIVALGAPVMLLAQTPVTGSLAGRVLREGDGNPLPGSRIELVGFFPPRRLQAKGDFRFDRLAPGNYRVRIVSLGYLPVDTVTSVVSGVVRRLVVNMHAVPVQLSAVTIRTSVAACEDGSRSTAGDEATPCQPKKPAKPCGAIVVLGMNTLLCTSSQLLVRTSVIRQETFLGPHPQILEAAQQAVTLAGLITERVLQLNDATWLILGRRGAKADDTGWARVEVEEVGADDTTVRVSMTALAALGTGRQSDDARALLATIKRRIK